MTNSTYPRRCAGRTNTATYLKAEWQHELNSDRDSYRVDILYTPDGAK